MYDKLKQLPVGIDDFKKIRERNTYFVDKSLFIKKIIENSSEVILFTRPRRFGKTLNFSMLKYFLEIPEIALGENKNDDYKYLFQDLAIYQEDDLIKNHMGKYPIINLSFKKIKANNWEDAKYLYKEEISREYNRHSYLLDKDIVSPAGSRKKYGRIINMEGRSIEYTSAIADLSKYLKKYHNRGTIVLIDEYDTPLHYAKLNGYYDEMMNIMRALMVDGMKGNENLVKGIVTGIMKISQESIFSSFNNPQIATLTDNYCKQYFGFTKEEVQIMLDYYDLNQYENLIEKWYNGYLFGGDTVIYNPWSVLNFISNQEHIPQLYWVNTGDTSLIKRCLQLDEISSKEFIKELLKGEPIKKELETNIIYEDVFNEVEKALSYLLHAGYLKAKRIAKTDEYLLTIPNLEINKIYKKILQNWFNHEEKVSSFIRNLLKSLFTLEIDKFTNYLASILLTLSSYYDAANVNTKIKKAKEVEETERYENFYHGLMLGIMVNIVEDYIVESNKEYGKGRPDIVLIPKDKSKRAYIFEFKNVYISSETSAKEAANEALEQIYEKEYTQGLKKVGTREIIQIGLGFKGKDVNVKWELIYPDGLGRSSLNQVKEKELIEQYGVEYDRR